MSYFSSNQHFCYWLQGYFEISLQPVLTKEKLIKIELALANIQEPLGDYTTWLKQVLDAIRLNDFSDHLLNYFTLMIRDELNHVFAHVIDDSYHTQFTSEQLQHIHDGNDTF